MARFRDAGGGTRKFGRFHESQMRDEMTLNSRTFARITRARGSSRAALRCRWVALSLAREGERGERGCSRYHLRRKSTTLSPLWRYQHLRPLFVAKCALKRMRHYPRANSALCSLFQVSSVIVPRGVPTRSLRFSLSLASSHGVSFHGATYRLGYILLYSRRAQISV